MEVQVLSSAPKKSAFADFFGAEEGSKLLCFREDLNVGSMFYFLQEIKRLRRCQDQNVFAKTF
ncbi:MAG: hypothetical protein HYT94_02605 [Parcubacteria group bacterium]|nr:hypothetical protein [Parcubacteria group bacterium]